MAMRYKARAEKLEKALGNVLEWAKGNRGSKDCNPYSVEEIKEALLVLAEIQGMDLTGFRKYNYLDADTQRFGR